METHGSHLHDHTTNQILPAVCDLHQDVRQKVCPSSAITILLAPLLHFVSNCALRLHATRCTNISNVHETIRNKCAVLCVHGPVTAGTLNDTRFLHTILHKQPSR